MENLLGEFEDEYREQLVSQREKALEKARKPSERFGNSSDKDSYDKSGVNEETDQRSSPDDSIESDYENVSKVKTENEDTFFLGEGLVVEKKDMGVSVASEISKGDNVAYKQTGETYGGGIPKVRIVDIL